MRLTSIIVNFSIFVIKNKSIYLYIYINNILLFDFNNVYLQSIKNYLKTQFKISDLDSISHYLDIFIIYTNNKISLD